MAVVIYHTIVLLRLMLQVFCCRLHLKAQGLGCQQATVFQGAAGHAAV
jgi:hypothetical protein